MNRKIIMTNQEAANELKELSKAFAIMPRGSSKSYIPFLIKIMAFCNAIELLEKTPD